uniref:Uncharacterized protein n=1 Tax=Meloidogyne javanica TaxID=6303 RepID=A0A915LWU8_MELJA
MTTNPSQQYQQIMNLLLHLYLRMRYNEYIFMGMCQISWRGPTGSVVYQQRALNILFTYMHHYLVQNLINVENAYCASLELSLRVRSECEITVFLYDVPAQQFEYPMRGSTVYCQLKNPKHDQTSEIRERFFQSISLISESESFDMIYLRSFIDEATRNFREILRVVMENYNKLSEWTKIFGKQISLDLNAILAGAGSCEHERPCTDNLCNGLASILLLASIILEETKD